MAPVQDWGIERSCPGSGTGAPCRNFRGKSERRAGVGTPTYVSGPQGSGIAENSRMNDSNSVVSKSGVGCRGHLRVSVIIACSVVTGTALVDRYQASATYLAPAAASAER